MPSKSVAVAMCVYKNDSFEHVKLAVESITINQTKENIYLFLHIDGEIDFDIESILSSPEFLKVSINVIRSNPGVGLANGLNKIINLILSEYPNISYIARMDADDISVENRIEIQYDFMERHKNIDILGSACIDFDGSKENGFFKNVPSEDIDIKKKLSYVCPIVHPSVMFRREVFVNDIRYTSKYKFCEDIELWLRLRSLNYTFGNVNESLVYYRLSDETLRRRLGFSKGISELKVRCRYLNFNYLELRYFFYILARPILHILPFFVFKALRLKFLKKRQVDV
jgi:hypothetical protein